MKHQTLSLRYFKRLASTVPVLAGLCAAGLLFTSGASASDYLSLGFTAIEDHNGGFVFNYNNNQSNTGAPLSDSAPSSPFISSQVYETLTGLQTSMSSRHHIVYDANGNLLDDHRGYSYFGANLIDTLTIVTPDPALDGTAVTLHFDYNLSGSAQFTNLGGHSYNSILVDGDQLPTPFQMGYSDGVPYGQDSLPAIRTGSASIYLSATGSTTGTSVSLSSQVRVTVGADVSPDAVTQDTQASANFSIRLGPVTLTSDATGAGISYTSTSAAGTGRGQNFPSGAPYASFNLVNNVGNQSNLALRDGTASTNQYVRAAFVAPPTPKAASDVVELNGTGNDPFVIQMSFNPNAPSFFGSDLFQLCWLPEGSTRWVNATLGNYQGPPPHFVGDRAYNSSTDFHLGYFGFDSANKVAWAVINHNSVYAVSAPLDLVSVVSRKTHGAAGIFDINLPLAGAPGVECRTGPNYTLVFAFTRNLTSGSASVTSGAGSVSATPTISENTITVNLSGVTNAQTTTVTVHGLTDVSSQLLPDTAVSMTTLIGDTSGNGLVTSTDVSQTKLQSGRAVTSSNFREDVNGNGTINGTDVSIAKLHVGSGAP